MGKGNRWITIYEDIREQILNGKLKPGAEIPTNLELSTKYKVHTGTIQTAIKALIQDGLIISKGKKSPRTVRIKPTRSKRSGGFSSDHENQARKKVLALEILDQNLPIPLQKYKEALYYHTEQFLNENLVAISRSYIPDTVPLQDLHQLLYKKPSASLYQSLEQFGHKPTTCKESLVAEIASRSDKVELHLPESINIPIVRIERKVYDQHDQLIELCFITCHADYYLFDYEFKF